MMLDWNQYHQEIKAKVGEMIKLSPDTIRGYRMVSEANSNTSKLGAERAS
jgi:hypothetical protein